MKFAFFTFVVTLQAVPAMYTYIAHIFASAYF